MYFFEARDPFWAGLKRIPNRQTGPWANSYIDMYAFKSFLLAPSFTTPWDVVNTTGTQPRRSWQVLAPQGTCFASGKDVNLTPKSLPRFHLAPRNGEGIFLWGPSAKVVGGHKFQVNDVHQEDLQLQISFQMALNATRISHKGAKLQTSNKAIQIR